MIKPHLKDDALLNDIREANRDSASLNLWWLGQSGYLLQTGGSRLLIDPYLSDSLTKKYAQTDKPHVRMTERAVDPARLNFIDAVTSSHNHTDHLDAETLLPLMRVNAGLRVIVPEANRAFAAERLQCPPERLTGHRRRLIRRTRQASEYTLFPPPMRRSKRTRTADTRIWAMWLKQAARLFTTAATQYGTKACSTG